MTSISEYFIPLINTGINLKVLGISSVVVVVVLHTQLQQKDWENNILACSHWSIITYEW